jgi:hypothetical protein
MAKDISGLSIFRLRQWRRNSVTESSVSKSGLKPGGVIDYPITECPRRVSGDTCDQGCNECRLADCGCERVQKHIYLRWRG